MSADYGSLIKQRRLELGLTLEQVGEACGVGKSTVRKWETGAIKNMGRDKIALLASVLRLDPTDLIDRSNNIMTLPSGLIPISQLQRHKIPVLGSMAAGEPIYDEEFPDVAIDGPLNADFALRVKGRSMEPTYLDGDLVFIKSVPDLPHDGAVCVISIDDEATIKHVYKHLDGLMLGSDNPSYAPMVYWYAEHTIRILGVPVGFLRMYK